MIASWLLSCLLGTLPYLLWGGEFNFINAWFESVSGLEPELVQFARTGLWIALLWPAASILQNYYQGIIVNGKKTWVVTLSIIVFMATIGLILSWGTLDGRYPGLYIGLVAFQAGYGAQALVLWLRWVVPAAILAAAIWWFLGDVLGVVGGV